MNLVPAAIQKTIARRSLIVNKNSPTLLFGVGIVGSVASTVLACRATLKLDLILDEAKNDLDVARNIEHKEYSEGDRKHDMTIIYVRSATKVARAYAPAVLLGMASVGCLTRSHNILQERNAALTAAYVAVDEAFKRYRSKVVEKYGEEEDRELRYETEMAEIHDPEKGKTVKKKVMSELNEHSQYARFFDQLSPNWSKQPEYNLVFLQCQQRWANDMLKARGHLFLNEVYDFLGLERTTAGSVVGWIVSDDGDNYVDFGIFDLQDNPKIDFVNGREGAVLLDFNVDGIIWDKIEPSKRGERLRWQS